MHRNIILLCVNFFGKIEEFTLENHILNINGTTRK